MISSFYKYNKILTLFILFGFLSNASLLFVQVDAADPNLITYSGYVRDTSSNPISGATVRLSILDDGSLEFCDTTSQANGYYTVSMRFFESTPPISYSLSAWKTGYVYSSIGGYINPGSYTHNFVLEEEAPTLAWIYPSNDQLITFPPTSNDFSFTYSANLLDSVRLYIGPADSPPTIQFGSSWTELGSSISKTVDIGEHMGDLHGLVRADLRGYVGASPVIEATRTFNFSKQLYIETVFLESGMEDQGSQLYLILYDPPGDKSYSTFTEETKVQIINKLTWNLGGGMEIKLKASPFRHWC